MVIRVHPSYNLGGPISTRLAERKWARLLLAERIVTYVSTHPIVSRSNVNGMVSLWKYPYKRSGRLVPYDHCVLPFQP